GGALRSIGFNVPGYGIVEKGTPRNNQLRYSKTASDSDAAYAGNRDRSLAKIKEADGSNWSLAVLPSSSSIRPGHFELWFASDRAPAATETPTPTPTSTPTATPKVTLMLVFVDQQGKELSIQKLRGSLQIFDAFPYLPADTRPIQFSTPVVSTAVPGLYRL